MESLLKKIFKFWIANKMNDIYDRLNFIYIYIYIIIKDDM